MGENLDEDSDYNFTLFTDIDRNVLAMHEQLNEVVPECLVDESDFENSSNKSVDSVSDDDDDIVPLSERKKKLSDTNKNCLKRTRRSRCSAKKSTKNSSQEKCDAASEEPQKNVDTIEILDSDSDVVCVEPAKNQVDDSMPSFNLSTTLDSSVDEIVIDDEDDNKLVPVKINWMNLRVHRFEVRKFQRFTTIFRELAEKEEVPKEKILLILRDTIFISEEDSPDSLKLSIVDIIEGGITKEACNKSNKNQSKRINTPSEDGNMLELKCVLKDLKKPLLVTIRKTDSMQKLMVKASEQLEQPLDKLKFMFEGEPLESSASPIDLDMEGGEVIHVHVREK